MTKNPEQTKYGRCEATNRQGNQCGRAAIGDHGKCGMHGGKAGRPLEHGIYSDVVREEDKAVLDELEKLSTQQKLEETLNLQLMKLRRAVELMDDPDREANFWDTFSSLAEAAQNGEELDAGQIKELANMLNTPHRAQRDLMDLIRKTAKDLHKITDGEKVQHEHGFDSDELEGLAEKADDMF